MFKTSGTVAKLGKTRDLRRVYISTYNETSAMDLRRRAHYAAQIKHAICSIVFVPSKDSRAKKPWSFNHRVKLLQ